MPFIPHTEKDVREMLAAIGVDSIDDLFDEIPAELRAKDIAGVPEGVSEMEIGRIMRERAGQDIEQVCFIGAGAYEHHIPAVVWELTSRGEFYSAYTPYQPEASQGTLQLIYEYQTMMAKLTGMDVSNASLYDGASGLAEAALMAVRANRRSKSGRILVPKTVHPTYRKVLDSIVRSQGIEILELDYDATGGNTTLDSLSAFEDEDITAVVIPQPNFFGVLEEVDALTGWAHGQKAMAIAVVNPTSLAILKAPGDWGTEGADIVCGEGQPLGSPLASGGPYFGFLCCKQAFVRQMPGRIVGRTTDLNGQEGFVLTLQAREQHIRRGKATSNICTNQGLLVTAATLYLTLLGPTGLRSVALACHENTCALLDRLGKVNGVERVFDRPVFHEAVLRLGRPAGPVVEAMAQRGILAGYALGTDYPELEDALLVCVTETRTSADMDRYVDELTAVLS
jgi:glycine dehydrogenase subunit 1